MSEPVRMESISPTLPVQDVEAALAFYEQHLGFRRGLVAGNPPVYATMSRDGLSLHLARNAEHAGCGSCWVILRGVDQFYEELTGAGVTVSRAIEDSSYGLRDFVIRDPDGNTMGLGEPIRRG